MKIFKREERTSKYLRNAIENCLAFHEKYKNSYFWTSSGNAAQRRRDEKRFAELNPPFDIVTKNETIQVRPELDISCKNIYYCLSIWVNGEKKNVRIIKGLI
jgi:hypothetical protein